MLSYNGFSPLTSNFRPYRDTTDYYRLSYPYANYSPYAYPLTLALNAYPNTLSIQWPSSYFQDLSHLAIDPATLPIIPKELLERPKQPDNSLHKLNIRSSFSYHQPDEEKNYYSGRIAATPSNMFMSFADELFTSAQNFQYILPDGRTGEVPIRLSLAPNTGKYDIDSMNKIIYDAKKARGDKQIHDAFGDIYNPEKKSDIYDKQDFVDESRLGQINDYYQYNILDNKHNSLQNRAFVNDVFNNISSGNDGLKDLFISDVLGSNTGLISPSIRETRTMTEQQNPSSYMTTFLSSMYGTPKNFYHNHNHNTHQHQHKLQQNPLVVEKQLPLDPNFPLKNAFTKNYNMAPINKKSKDNPLAAPFNKSEYNDYTGTNIGEYYHIMQYMQESLADITKVKVPYLTANGNAISQQSASSALTGNIPTFDPLAESYGWMAISPYYQDYVDKHIRDEHGGVHDVITPRGFTPEDLFAGGRLTMNQNVFTNQVYKSPPFIPATMTNPLVHYRIF